MITTYRSDGARVTNGYVELPGSKTLGVSRYLNATHPQIPTQDSRGRRLKPTEIVQQASDNLSSLHQLRSDASMYEYRIGKTRRQLESIDFRLVTFVLAQEN